MYKRIIYFLSIISLFISCKKNNDFIGKDNFITSFSLKKGGTTFTAAITDTTIIITVPEGFSLDSATAQVQLSEHASIYPNPASLISWNEESLFVVNAWDGTRKTYRYTIQRNDISLDNSVVLATQADVDGFAAKGVTEITGNLIIGSTTSADSITNLNGLYKLRKVGYSLIIYPTFSGSEIIGLENLTSVGGDLRIEHLNDLVKVSLPSLEIAKSISIKNSLTENIALPKLSDISQSLSLEGPLNVLSLPNLQQVDGSLTLHADNSIGSSLIQVIALSSLTSAGSINISNFGQLTKLSFPILNAVSSDLNLSNLPAFYNLSCPSLQKVTGSITLPSACKLSLVSLPKLTNTGGLVITGSTIDAMELPALTTIDGRLTLANTKLQNLDAFNTLTSVKTVEISWQSSLISFAGLQHAFPSIDAANWNVYGNAYNPTYEDLQAGNWTKP